MTKYNNKRVNFRAASGVFVTLKTEPSLHLKLEDHIKRMKLKNRINFSPAQSPMRMHFVHGCCRYSHLKQ
jgi:hypothetical protein